MQLSSALIPFFIIVFCSNLVEAVAGFGSVILAVTFGAYFFSVQELVPILVPLNILLGGILLFKYHHDIHFKQLFKRILLGTGLGMPIGIYLFNSAPNEVIKPIFGMFVFILAAFELWSSFRLREKPSPLVAWKAWFFLFSGGIIQGLYASGGPMVVYYSVREFENKKELRSTLAALWMILNLVLAGTMLYSGKINPESLKTDAALIPAVLLGFFVGDKIHDRVSEKTFRMSVYILLLIAGAGLFLSKN